MDKNKKIIMFVPLAIVLVALIAVLLLNNREDKETVIFPNKDQSAEPLTASTIDPSVVAVPEPINWQEEVRESGADFEVVFMSDEEKSAMGIELEKRVQVLARDEATGIALAYKVINSDSDIITSAE